MNANNCGEVNKRGRSNKKLWVNKRGGNGILALPRQHCHDSIATTDSIIGMNANNCGEVNKRGGSNKNCD